MPTIILIKNVIRDIVLYKTLLIVYEYIMYQSNKTNFNMLFYYLGQHVSNLIESPSGSSMIQILHSYILEITIYSYVKNVSIWDTTMHFKHC